MNKFGIFSSIIFTVFASFSVFADSNVIRNEPVRSGDRLCYIDLNPAFDGSSELFSVRTPVFLTTKGAVTIIGTVESIVGDEDKARMIFIKIANLYYQGSAGSRRIPLRRIWFDSQQIGINDSVTDFWNYGRTNQSAYWLHC